MNIGKAAKETGLSPKMIRYYESKQLIKPTGRSNAGYREFTQQDLNTLQFIKHARDIDFSLDDIAILLRLNQNTHRQSKEVKAVAMKHLKNLELKIQSLLKMKQHLTDLVSRCPGDSYADCPILSEFSNKKGRGKPLP